jgi:hypothetical protein
MSTVRQPAPPLGKWVVRLRVKAGFRTRLRALRYRRRWGFAPPPAWSDISGYEAILEELERHEIRHVEGDVVEIGAFKGGGTYKLCKYFERVAPGKRVYSIDVFDPGFDVSPLPYASHAVLEGKTNAEGYAFALEGQDQRSVYDDVTGSCTNLVTIACDSAQVELPTNRLAYAHIDGNHEASYVHSDFELVWPAVASGGIVSFDDYGDGEEAGLEQVNHAVHELIGQHAAESAMVWTDRSRTIFVKRR